MRLKPQTVGYCRADVIGDFKDTLPTDGMGDSENYSGTAPYGTPDDPTAWFNVLPPYMAVKPLSFYFDSKINYLTGLPDRNTPQNCMPFPGRAGSPIWFCPSASMTDAQVAILAAEPLGPGGIEGFFAYAMPIDLNKEIGTGITSSGALSLGTTYPFPQMPRLSNLPKPSATVLMFDQCFNPVTEIDNASPTYNSENPADRYRSLASRHFLGAVLNFCDGHAKYYKDYYLTNGSGTYEAPVPDVIWDAAYRAALGY